MKLHNAQPVPAANSLHLQSATDVLLEYSSISSTCDVLQILFEKELRATSGGIIISEKHTNGLVGPLDSLEMLRKREHCMQFDGNTNLLLE